MSNLSPKDENAWLWRYNAIGDISASSNCDYILIAEAYKLHLLDRSVPGVPTSENISASTGGTVERGNAKIEIPPNALPQDTVITMVETTITAPSGYTMVSQVYDIGPTDVALSTPATITLPYDESALPAGVSETKLAIWRKTGTEWENLGGTVNATANTVSVQIDHLSEYAVMVPTAGGVTEGMLLVLILAAVIISVSLVAALLLIKRRKSTTK